MTTEGKENFGGVKKVCQIMIMVMGTCWYILSKMH